MENFILIGTEAQIEKAEKIRNTLLKGIDNYINDLKEKSFDISPIDIAFMTHMAFKCKDIISNMAYAEDIIKVKMEAFTSHGFGFVIRYSKGLAEIYFNYIQFGNYKCSQKSFFNRKSFLWDIFYSTYHLPDNTENKYHNTPILEQVEEYNKWAESNRYEKRELASDDYLELGIYNYAVDNKIANKIKEDDMYYLLKAKKCSSIKDFTHSELNIMDFYYQIRTLLKENLNPSSEEIFEAIIYSISRRPAPIIKATKKKK